MHYIKEDGTLTAPCITRSQHAVSEEAIEHGYTSTKRELVFTFEEFMKSAEFQAWKESKRPKGLEQVCFETLSHLEAYSLFHLLDHSRKPNSRSMNQARRSGLLASLASFSKTSPRSVCSPSRILAF